MNEPTLFSFYILLQMMDVLNEKTRENSVLKADNMKLAQEVAEGRRKEGEREDADKVRRIQAEGELLNF